jgi:hypothetical protein
MSKLFSQLKQEQSIEAKKKNLLPAPMVAEQASILAKSHWLSLFRTGHFYVSQSDFRMNFFGPFFCHMACTPEQKMMIHADKIKNYRPKRKTMRDEIPERSQRRGDKIPATLGEGDEIPRRSQRGDDKESFYQQPSHITLPQEPLVPIHQLLFPSLKPLQ